MPNLMLAYLDDLLSDRARREHDYHTNNRLGR